MDEHAAGFSKPEGASKKTAVARERKMAHFPRGLAASFGGNEFVVFPECAVDESEIAFVQEALPIFADSRKARSVEQPLLLLKQLETDNGFLRRKAAPERFAHVIGEASHHRDGRAEEAIFLSRPGRRSKRKQPVQGERVPARRGVGARQNPEKAVLFGEDAAHRQGRVDVERLKLPEVKQAHHAINVGAREEDG